MTMRSAMHRAFRCELERGRWREHQGHREHRAVSCAGAVGGNVATHATRELARDREPEASAVGHALTAAAVVEIEQFLGDFRLEAASVIANLEAPPAFTGG